MRADGKAVRLVAQPLNEIEHGIALCQHEGLFAGHEELFPPRIAVRPLGDTCHRHLFLDTQLAHYFHDGVELAQPAIDQQQVGPLRHGVISSFSAFRALALHAAGNAFFADQP